MAVGAVGHTDRRNVGSGDAEQSVRKGEPVVVFLDQRAFACQGWGWESAWRHCHFLRRICLALMKMSWRAGLLVLSRRVMMNKDVFMHECAMCSVAYEL